MSQFDPDCDCCFQSSQTFGKIRLYYKIKNKITVFPPGYMQTEEMFNLWSCDLLQPAEQIGGKGVFHLLLFSCHAFGIHFHIHIIDEHLYSSILVLLIRLLLIERDKHFSAAALKWWLTSFIINSKLDFDTDCKASFIVSGWLFFREELHLKILHNANDFNVILSCWFLCVSWTKWAQAVTPQLSVYQHIVRILSCKITSDFVQGRHEK